MTAAAFAIDRCGRRSARTSRCAANRCGLRLFLAVGVVLLATSSVANPLVDAACRATRRATEKLLHTPHHSFRYTSAAAPDNEAAPESEMIVLNRDTFVRLPNGGWQKGVSVGELENAFRERLAHARDFSCHYVRDEVLKGEITALYVTREVSAIGTNDTTVWISKARGLIVQSETDNHLGGEHVIHVSIRHDYVDIHVPQL